MPVKKNKKIKSLCSVMCGAHWSSLIGKQAQGMRASKAEGEKEEESHSPREAWQNSEGRNRGGWKQRNGLDLLPLWVHFIANRKTNVILKAVPFSL